MPSLEERFRLVTEVRPPDLWPDIGRREPRVVPEPRRPRPALAASVALAVAVAGLALAFRAFLAGPAPPRPATTVENGLIAFVTEVASDTYVGGVQSEIFVMSPDGTIRTRLTHDPESFDEDPAWSPVGTRIAFVKLGELAAPGLYVMNADGSDSTLLVEDGTGPTSPSWSPDGTRIVFETGLGQESTGSGDRDIYVVEVATGGLTRLTTDPARDEYPAVSPDGSRIAFTRQSQGDADIYVMGADGSDVTQLTSGEGIDLRPAWSPDGTKIVFERDGGIHVMNADGSGLSRLSEGPAEDRDSVWAPDGTVIGFVRDGDIYTMDPAGTTLTRITDDRAGYSRLAWQPAEPTPSEPPEQATVEMRVSATERVGEFPSAVAFGEGGAWVTTCCTDGSGSGDLVRLDPVTGEVVVRIPIRAVPGWDFGGAGLTIAGGSVWTLGAASRDGGCCDGIVTRIDPATNAMVDELTVPGITDGDLWVDGDAVYVLGFAAEGGGLDLAKVDATTHEIAWRVTVPGQWSQTVFAAGGSVWVLGTAPDARGPVEVTTWYRFDPATGALLDELQLPQSMYIPAVHEDTIWYRTADGAQRLDATSGELVGEPVQPGPGCCVGPFVSDGAGGVWVVSSPGAGIERSIWHIDASGAVVASGTIADKETFERMLGQSYAFDPETQTIWVQHYEDSVTRIEIAHRPADEPVD